MKNSEGRGLFRTSSHSAKCYLTMKLVPRDCRLGMNPQCQENLCLVLLSVSDMKFDSQ